VPGERIDALDVGDVLHLGDARLMGVFAAHTGDSIGVVIEYHGVRVYMTGDSLYDDRLVDVGALGGVDVLVTCINGKLGNMPAEDAAKLARLLKCRVAVPVHFGMFRGNTEDPQRFVDLLNGSGVYVRVPGHDESMDVYELLRDGENQAK